MGSKANSQQDPVHWPREITKAKLSQAKSFFIHIFLLNNGKRGRKGIFGQFWAVLGKLGQVWIRHTSLVEYLNLLYSRQKTAHIKADPAG